MDGLHREMSRYEIGKIDWRQTVKGLKILYTMYVPRKSLPCLYINPLAYKSYLFWDCDREKPKCHRDSST